MHNNNPHFTSNLKNAFSGKDSYSIGLVFLTGYLLTFFSKMKVNNVSKIESFAILFFVALACSAFY